MIKKVSCYLLLMMVLAIATAMTGPVYAAERPAKVPLLFADVSEDFWARQVIENWSSRDVITGDNQGFRPNDSLTRAEMMTILSKVFGYSKGTANPFCDIQESDWYYGALVKAYAKGILQGNFNGNKNRIARPNDALTRAEAAALLSRLFSVSGDDGDNTKFNDIQPDWAKKAIYGMEAAGYVKGADGLYHPANNLSRAEAVQMLDNIVKLYVYQPGSYAGDTPGNVVINTSDAALKDMTVSGNLYLTEGIGEGAVTLENVTVTGNTYVRGGGAGQISIKNCNLGMLVIEKEGLDLDRQTEDQSQPASITSHDGGSGGSGGSGGNGGSDNSGSNSGSSDTNEPDDSGSGDPEPGGGEIIDI